MGLIQQPQICAIIMFAGYEHQLATTLTFGISQANPENPVRN